VDLTGRQREFLSDFIDLYREAQEPLHYSQVAERLGVSNITAYDMLKLLEEHDMVRSEYVLPERRKGPGRSTIVFSPAERADALFAKLAGNERDEIDWDQAEWDQVKEQILESLPTEDHADYQQLLTEVMQRIPESRTPMVYAAEMITAMILTLHQVQDDATTNLRDSLTRLGLPGELGLSALAGLSLGLSFVERANRHLTQRLVSCTGRYQEILAELGPTNRQRLSDFTQDVIRRIEF